MATQQINGSSVTATSTINNGGTMVAHGTSVNLNVKSPAEAKVGVFGSTVVDGTDVDPAVAGQAVAHNHVGPIMKGLTVEIAGTGNAAISTIGGNPDNIRSIHKLETLRTTKTTTGLRDGNFNMITGVWASGYPVTVVDSGLASDDAANPSRAIPGELTFLYGAPTASGAKYSSKNT